MDTISQFTPNTLKLRTISTLAVSTHKNTCHVATMKVELGAVIVIQNGIKAEMNDIKASQTVIFKNLKDIIIQQEDMILRHEAMIKQ